MLQAPAWPDSVVITKDGKPAGYDWVYPHPKPGATTLQYIYAPHVGNEYGRFLAERVALALKAGMDGFCTAPSSHDSLVPTCSASTLYRPSAIGLRLSLADMDFFDYAMSENPSRQFRHTYNLSLTGWDGRSVVSS